jgi:hypothetical protein
VGETLAKVVDASLVEAFPGLVPSMSIIFTSLQLKIQTLTSNVSGGFSEISHILISLDG